MTALNWRSSRNRRGGRASRRNQPSVPIKPSKKWYLRGIDLTDIAPPQVRSKSTTTLNTVQ